MSVACPAFVPSNPTTGVDPLDSAIPSTALGIDLGGTKLRGARCPDLLDRALGVHESGTPPDAELTEDLRRERVGDRRDPASLVERVATLIEALRRADPAPKQDATVPVGIGVAGMPRGRDGFIVEAPNLGWLDVPFGSLLRDRLGTGYRVRIVNDVNAVTYGEFALGAGIGAGDVLAVYVGTGVGGGFVCNGRLVEGAGGSAGEIGHLRVERGPGARRCGCGKVGCVEAYAGGRALDERIARDLREGRESAAVELAGGADEVTVAHVDRAAEDGDPYAKALWDEAAELLGTAVGNAVTLLNPERLIFGGGVFWRTPHLRDRVSEMVRSVAPRATVSCLSIVSASLGDDAGIVGAALLAAEGR